MHQIIVEYEGGLRTKAKHLLSGDEIIKMPDGSLTTIYHFLKNSNMKIEEFIMTNQFQEVN